MQACIIFLRNYKTATPGHSCTYTELLLLSSFLSFWAFLGQVLLCLASRSKNFLVVITFESLTSGSFSTGSCTLFCCFGTALHARWHSGKLLLGRGQAHRHLSCDKGDCCREGSRRAAQEASLPKLLERQPICGAETRKLICSAYIQAALVLGPAGCSTGLDSPGKTHGDGCLVPA